MLHYSELNIDRSIFRGCSCFCLSPVWVVHKIMRLDLCLKAPLRLHK